MHHLEIYAKVQGVIKTRMSMKDFHRQGHFRNLPILRNKIILNSGWDVTLNLTQLIVVHLNISCEVRYFQNL